MKITFIKIFWRDQVDDSVIQQMSEKWAEQLYDSAIPYGVKTVEVETREVGK